MTIEIQSAHVTPTGGNVFTDLGFSPEHATSLKKNAQRIISEKLMIKTTLMREIAKWIDENQLKQGEAAEILGISRSRLSDVVTRKSVEFTIDALVDMLCRTGKNIQLSIR